MTMKSEYRAGGGLHRHGYSNVSGSAHCTPTILGVVLVIQSDSSDPETLTNAWSFLGLTDVGCTLQIHFWMAIAKST